jgi:O-antigen/teichoic acid export membrane protein
MRKCVLLLVTAALLLACALPTAAVAGPTDGQGFAAEPTAGPLRVYYAGPDGAVRTALELAADPALNPERPFELVADPAGADVLVLNGTVPDPERLADLVRQGAGLVLILGPELPAGAVEALLGVPVSLERRDDPLGLVAAAGASDPLLSEIQWTSAPQVRERLALSSPASDLQSLVLGFEDQSLAVSTRQVGQGRAYVLAPFLDAANPQLQGWAYFNYLVYHLVERAAGRSPLSFAGYGGSPVPHARERAVLFAALGGMLLLSLLAFWLVRRYSRAHPEALDTLVADRAEFARREVATGWEEIGFHRPLGGFLFALMLGLVLFVPMIIYQNLILPAYILPSAQALGIWGRVTQLFNLLWLLFDLGTSVAFIKFMAQYRVLDPRRAVQYGQVFVWWQALSGAVQVAAVTAVAGTLLPQSPYALYAWSVIVHTFIQLPGFYQVYRHALTGLQRFDYAQMVDTALYLVFPMITQPVIVLLMVAWGRAHPVFGVATGGLLGLGLAAYASEALALLLGLWLYRRLGYNARVYFLAHFDWATVKSAFRFGAFEMLGSVAWAVGQAVEIVITQARLVNYAEVWGNWGIAQNFIFAYQVLQTLYNNLMPSISEAISHARRSLSQYYAAIGYKWGGIISAFIAAVLLATADRFILGATGPEFVRAAAYAVPLIVWGAIQYPSWVGDNVQLGANRPQLKALLVAMEQAIRIVLALLLVRRFQINALILAYFVGLLTKDIVAYVINNRACFPQRFYVWQSLTAPLLAGAAHYLVLRWLGGLLWQGDQVTSILIFFVGILPSFPLFAFFYGLVGGWDDGTLAELRQAVRLSSFLRPLAWLFWAATALGARISPLHGRFPISIRAQALDEAQSLADERVSLV